MLLYLLMCFLAQIQGAAIVAGPDWRIPWQFDPQFLCLRRMHPNWGWHLQGLGFWPGYLHGHHGGWLVNLRHYSYPYSTIYPCRLWATWVVVMWILPLPLECWSQDELAWSEPFSMWFSSAWVQLPELQRLR